MDFQVEFMWSINNGTMWNKTLYKLWNGYVPNLSYLKVWRCWAKIGIPNFKRSKIRLKTFDCVFTEYAQNNAAYRFWNLHTNSILETKDAEFFEHIYPKESSLPSTSFQIHF